MEANFFLAALSGFLGALILTALIYTLKASGQRLDIPYLIGTRFIDPVHSSQVYLLGNLLHLVIGALWGILYVFMISAMAVTPNWPIGILWGLGHGIFVGAMMGIIADSHPAIGAGKPIDDPGIMGSSWGTLIPYWILALHIIFGASSMGIYHYLVSGLS